MRAYRPHKNEVTVREERPGDAQAIRRVVECAFGRPGEADLVERLRLAGVASISLVAVEDGDEVNTESDGVVGHILFSPVTIEGETSSVPALGLAPLAVVPERQRGGVGSALVESGLAQCRKGGVEVVVVLGHSGYYPRFGFRPAHLSNLTCEYDSPAEAFMAIELQPRVRAADARLVRYHRAFAEL